MFNNNLNRLTSALINCKYVILFETICPRSYRYLTLT